MERPQTRLLRYATSVHFYTLVAVFVHPFNGICAVGVVNMSLPLSDQPVFGEWLVFVEVQGYTYNKSFEVQKYGKDPGTKLILDRGVGTNAHSAASCLAVMPKFELVIEPPPYIRDLNSCQHASVRARYASRKQRRPFFSYKAGVKVSSSDRYTFGKPVVGKLTVNMTVNGVGYYRQETGQPLIKTMEVSVDTTRKSAYVFEGFPLSNPCSAAPRSKVPPTSASASKT